MASSNPNAITCLQRLESLDIQDGIYIPMACGWVYLCAIVDWASRKVLSHRVSISMDTAFCVEALEEAFARYGQPEFFNTDQGSQFTSEAFTDARKARGVAISMDGKGAWQDNVFVERLWRSIKYEEVHLHAYDSVAKAKTGIARYISFYNTVRPHSSLDKQNPNGFYLASLPAIKQAA